MTLLDRIQKIINDCEIKSEYEISSVGVLLNKRRKIKLNEPITQELFCDLFKKTCDEFGSLPTHVDSYYGYIWTIGTEYLSYNVIEEYYNCDFIVFFIFNKMPMGKKLEFQEYVRIDGTVRLVLSEHDFAYDNYLHYFGNSFRFIADNDTKEYLLTVTKRSLVIHCLKKEPIGDRMTKMIPQYTKKEKIKL